MAKISHLKICKRLKNVKKICFLSLFVDKIWFLSVHSVRGKNVKHTLSVHKIYFTHTQCAIQNF
jgi:hypothetical protein